MLTGTAAEMVVLADTAEAPARLIDERTAPVTRTEIEEAPAVETGETRAASATVKLADVDPAVETPLTWAEATAEAARAEAPAD